MKKNSAALTLVLALAAFSSAQVASKTPAPESGTDQTLLIIVTVVALLAAGAALIAFVGVLLWYLKKKR